MSNSPLVSCTRLSPNYNKRNHAIDRISIHCTAGNCNANTLINLAHFVNGGRPNSCSCNYAVGMDGKVGLCVEECNRSWCTSNAANDHRAVTIEVSSSHIAPYVVNDKAFATMLDLVTDICKRNGKKKLIWLGDKDKTLAYKQAPDEMVMTVHCWFANKACPGKYLLDRHPQIAAEVTRRLSGTISQPATPAPAQPAKVYYLVRVSVSDLHIRKGPGTNYPSTGFIKPNVYTIVEESAGEGANKWGKLKSGAGWIALDFVKRV